MKISFNLLRALNVRRDEWWLVQKLFFLQFFQGAGIAFFFTSAFSRFLEHFQVSSLAYVYILSSFLLWISGFIYNKLEHRLPASRLYFIMTFVLAVSMIVFRVGAEFIDHSFYYFLMLAWFNVLYLLNNLMFWGMASQLYDVRQSKRLFGVISAGDIPAKFIGYSVASFIVYYTGTLNLLIAGFLCILLSFPFLKKILHAARHEPVQHTGAPKHTGALRSIVKNFSANLLIRRVAILSLIVSACIILINYAFYAEVKQAYKDDVALAGFIAMFLATARLIALVIKILFTSRLLYFLGNRVALLITPILLICLIVILLFTNNMTDSSKIMLYIFGLSAIAVDVLHSAINSPVLLTMMQPLSMLERLRAHNIVKGIMDPFAYLFSGLFLLVFFKINLYSLQALSFVLLALAFAWVIGIFKVHQQYLKTLIKTISSRYFSQEELNMYDSTTRSMIEEKINSGSELEVLYILNMLGTRWSEESTRLIIHSLKHSSPLVVSEALRIIGQLHIKDAGHALAEIIEKHPDEKIRSEAIKVLSAISFQDAIIVPLMYSDEKSIRRSAIVSILNHSHSSNHITDAENKIRELFETGNDDEKKEAAYILCETDKGSFDDQLIRLLDHPEIELRLASIKAIGHRPATRCLEHLIEKINEHEKPVLEALEVAGEKSLPFIKKLVLNDSLPARQKENLMNTIGRIGGKESHELLLDLIPEQPSYQSLIIKTLHRGHFKANHGTRKFIESVTHEYLIAAAAIVHMQKRMLVQKDKYEMMHHSLQLELHEMREILLFLFAFLYDREKISKIKTAMEINKKETNANAIELVDMTVKKEFANPFNAVFEHGDIEHRSMLLRSIFPKDLFPGIEEVITEILTDKNLSYNNWTKACSIYISKKYNIPTNENMIIFYLQSENRLIKETAEYALKINH